MLGIYVAEVQRPGDDCPTQRHAASESTMADIAEEIRAGGDTGDCFRDFSIALYGRIDDVLVKGLQALNASLAGHKGELVLMHYPVQIPVGHSTTDDRTLFSSRTGFRCGVLTEDRLIFNLARISPSCTIPVKRRAYKHYRTQPVWQTTSRIEYEDGPISLKPFFGRDENRFVVGDVLVQAWLARHEPSLTKSQLI